MEFQGTSSNNQTTVYNNNTWKNQPNNTSWGNSGTNGWMNNTPNNTGWGYPSLNNGNYGK